MSITPTATAPGDFTPGARAAIKLAGLDRCAGCRRLDLSAQHRHPRSMGGTSDPLIGHPANGVPLCGGALAGVLGCHGWAERHRADAQLLGWALPDGAPIYGTPWYAAAWDPDGRGEVWVEWVDVDGWPFVRLLFVDLGDVDRVEERRAAVARMRVARPFPEPPRLMAPKSKR